MIPAAAEMKEADRYYCLGHEFSDQLLTMIGLLNEESPQTGLLLRNKPRVVSEYVTRLPLPPPKWPYVIKKKCNVVMSFLENTTCRASLRAQLLAFLPPLFDGTFSSCTSGPIH